MVDCQAVKFGSRIKISMTNKNSFLKNAFYTKKPRPLM